VKSAEQENPERQIVVKTEPTDNPNYRAENMRKALEVRKQKLQEKKLSEQLLNLSENIDDKLEIEVAAKVDKLLQDSDSKKLKANFYRVFYKSGGVRGLISWIQSDGRHRLEYYKLLIGLLKAETQKPTSEGGQKQAVIVNIINPDSKQEIIVGGQQPDSD